MDLQTLQSQLKVAIQKHQIVVGKMRQDPQNSSLQKQLHDLQTEIMSLSDKQKQVVQQLRKDLDKKQHRSSSVLPSRAIISAQQSVIQKSAIQTQALSLTTKPTQSTAQQIIQHVVPSLVNNLVAAATGNVSFKTPIAAAVLLPNAAASSLLQASRSNNDHHNKAQPLLVVPSPAVRPGTDGQHAGVVFNLAPPIRVPQYPPPNSRTTTTTTCQTNIVTSTVNACITAPVAQSTIKERRNSILSSSNVRHNSANKTNTNEQVKMNFISALGLVTKDALNELQSKRVERKRRTTANPQFSNAAIEEKRKNALLNSDGSSSFHHGPFKRPRGRPRNNPITPTTSRPTTPEMPQPTTSPTPAATVLTPTKDNGTMVTITYTNHRSPREISLVNGFHPIAIKPAPPPPAPSLPVTQLQRDLDLRNGTQKIQTLLAMLQKEITEEQCAVCRQMGELQICKSCKCPYHSKCLQSTPKPWHCPKCDTYQTRETPPQWNETVAVVHSYIAIKAAKEEEKKKLLKRSLELKSERTELEEKKKHLNSVINEQRQARTELELNHKKSQDSLEKLHQVVTLVRQVS